MDLQQVWKHATSHSAQLQAHSASSLAARTEAEAYRRSRRPSLTFTLQGDAGQRARPGDERVTGPTGARGDLTALMTWPLYESQRSALERSLDELAGAAEDGEEALIATLRLEATWAYLDVVASDAALEHLEVLYATTRDLATVVELRVQEEVESPYAALVMTQRLGQIEEEIDLARTRQTLAREHLVELVGDCVLPSSPTGFASSSPGAEAVEEEPARIVVGNHPELSALEASARASRARAQALHRTGLFDVAAIGGAGLYASRAFDDVFEPEYYAGIRAQWRPDWSGVRRAQAEAEAARSRALAFDAEEGRRILERESRLLEAEIIGLRRTMDRVDEQAELARERLRVASLRFEEGIDPITELIDAHRTLSIIEGRRLDNRAALNLLYLRLAGATHRWELLPALLVLPSEAP